jgi:hypothetical protein
MEENCHCLSGGSASGFVTVSSPLLANSAAEAAHDASASFEQGASWPHGQVEKRTSVADRPTGPRETRSPVLSVEEEAVIVASIATERVGFEANESTFLGVLTTLSLHASN